MFKLFTFSAILILFFECFNEPKNVTRSLNNAQSQGIVDSVLAQKIYDKFCGELESSKDKIKSSGDLLLLIPDIESRLFFSPYSNQDFQLLVSKMPTTHSNTKQNVEFAFKYILVKVIKECPMYARGWGQRGEVKKSSILFAQDGCECVKSQSNPEIEDSKKKFFKKLEIYTHCTSVPSKNDALKALFQSEIDRNNPEQMRAFGTNALASLMTTCDDMINAYLDLTMEFAKEPISVWGNPAKK